MGEEGEEEEERETGIKEKARPNITAANVGVHT